MTNQTDPAASKDPNDWTTGDEDATAPQKSYIETLDQQTGEQDDVDSLTKAQASERIEELQKERQEREAPNGDGQDIAADTDPDLSDDEAA